MLRARNPTAVRPQVQPDLAHPAAAGTGKAKAADKADRPRSLTDQARAVRAPLPPSPATAGELAKSFKGATVDRVAELLATLASLGQARPAGDGRYAA